MMLSNLSELKLIMACVFLTIFGCKKESDSETKVDLGNNVHVGADVTSGIDTAGHLDVQRSDLFFKYENFSIQQVKEYMSTGRSQLIPKNVYGIEIKISLSALLAAASAKKNFKEKLDEVAVEKKHELTEHYRGEIQQKVVAAYPGFSQAEVTGITAKQLEGAIPTIHSSVDDAIGQIKEEGFERIRKTKKAAVFQGLMFTYGHRLNPRNEYGDMFVYMRVGKGSHSSAVTDRNDNTAYQAITGQNGEVQQMGGFQLTGVVTAGIIQAIGDSSSLEIAFTGVHARGRNHFVSGSQYLLDNLSLDRDDWNSADKLYALDTAVLDIVFRKGIQYALNLSLAVGQETKFGIGASYTSLNGRFTVVIDLLYSAKTVNNLAKGFSVEALASYRLIGALTVYGSAGTVARVGRGRPDMSKDIFNVTFQKIGATLDVMDTKYGKMRVGAVAVFEQGDELTGNDITGRFFVSYRI